MTRTHVSVCAILLATVVSGWEAGCTPPPSAPARTTAGRAASADLVVRGGEVLTMDPAHPRAHAVAIRGERVVAVGENAEIDALVGPQTRVVELKGRTVLPGLIDGHAHLFGYGKSLAEIDLRGCDSPDACAARVKSGAASSLAWVTGRGWDQNAFVRKEFPEHGALDRVESARPVWLRRVDGHAGWANASALKAAGITRATREPADGRIVRAPDGEPTGVLVDGAMGLVEKVIPPMPRETRERAIERAQKEVLAVGITAVHEMGIEDETVEAYRALEKRGALTLRIYAFAAAGGFDGPVDDAALDRVLSRAPDPKTSEARFKLRGVKLFADGALGSRGAALLAPYSDDPKNTGIVVTPPDVIEHAARRALASGWQIAVHAIGDRANRAVLDAFERAGCTRANDHRFRIEHAQIVALTDIPRFAALGVLPSMQPMHATSDMPWAPSRLGPERLAGAYAWRRFLDAGSPIVGGSDFPVERVDPIGGNLFAAVTRTDKDGAPPGGFLPDQKMTLDEAVRAFSSSAAYGAFEESWHGRLAPGFAADLTILDRDITVDPARALAVAKSAVTIIAGRVAYER